MPTDDDWYRKHLAGTGDDLPRGTHAAPEAYKVRDTSKSLGARHGHAPRPRAPRVEMPTYVSDYHAAPPHRSTAPVPVRPRFGAALVRYILGGVLGLIVGTVVGVVLIAPRL